MAVPFYGLIEEACVMLVDNDKTFVAEMMDWLKSYNYKVTAVDTASTAMSKLSKETEKIDMLIISVHSSNLHCFELLTQAVASDIVSIFVCGEHNELLGKKALDMGACLYLKRPFDKEIIKHLWQFVLTKKAQKEKEGEGQKRDQMNVEGISDDVASNERYSMMRKRGRNSLNDSEGERQTSDINKTITQKTYIEWTEELHAKFMKAVDKLGEGRCYPKEILEEMNVPGLTKMQVGSHLQKCRSNNRKAPGERKSVHRSSDHASSDGSQQESSFRKYETMPNFQTNVPSLQHNSNPINRGSEFPSLTLGINNVFAGGESSIPPRLHYLSIINSLISNPFLPTQNNVHVQHRSLFRSHDYNLDLNVAPGTNIENVTTMADTHVDELGASSTNIQPHISDQPSNIGRATYESDAEGSEFDLNLAPPNAKSN